MGGEELWVISCILWRSYRSTQAFQLLIALFMINKLTVCCNFLLNLVFQI